jgi:hypothetical protein
MWILLEQELLAASHESDLQVVFDAWPEHVAGKKAGLLLAGVPRMLERLPRPSRPCTPAFGYSFTPDALFSDGEHQLVVELKRAAYEPLPLAEALHHAEFLSAYASTPRPTTPVIVSSYNCWLRLALANLRRNSYREGALGYFEVDWLREPGTRRRILWFDAPIDPFAPADPAALPACIDDEA